MLVQQILKTKGNANVVTVLPGSSVQDAARILADKRIGTVVISTDGTRAEGILSERDIVRELADRGSACMSDKVENVMTANPVTCNLSDSSDGILETMTERRFRHMPVVEAGKMVGLVTLGDVVKARLSELAMEKDALEGMIMGH